MREGKDVLIVFDDLSKHALAYRAISLLLKRFPGREAYPGDVFYLDARLLERVAQLSDKEGSGSITALPIVETQGGDISGYISTNIISITDGQIYLDAEAFNEGILPAVNIGLSVSRIGSAVQEPAVKKISSGLGLKVKLSQYKENKVFSQFSSTLDKKTQETIEEGEKISRLMSQNVYSPLEIAEQILFLAVIKSGALR